MSAVALGVGRGSPMVSNSADWLLRDEFISDLAAGSVNGTAAEPGPGTRTVVDTESKIAVLGGELVFSGGKASHAYGDPVIGLGTVSRTPGRTGIFNLRLPATTGFVRFGFNSSYSTATPTEAIVVLNSAAIALYTSAAANVIVGAADATTYSVAFALRSSGVMLLIKGGAFAQWTLLYATDYSNSATLYSLISNYSYQLASGYIRVPAALWLPTPLASDGFGSAFGTTDGLGHAEGIAGGIGAGGSGLTWSNAGSTWSVSGGKAINTPTQGENVLVNGDFSAWTGNNPNGWTLPVAEDGSNYATEVLGALRFVAATGSIFRLERPALSVGTWYAGSASISSISGSVFYLQSNAGMPAVQVASSGIKTWTGRSQGSEARIWNGGGSAVDAQLDDWTFKPLTLSQLISVADMARADVFAGAALTRGSSYFQLGLALSWDSASNPQNGVVVILRDDAIFVDKCVAGVWSQVSGAAQTYSAGARLVVAKSGSEYRVYYNSVLVGSYTISDASIINNTLHGLFSTDASNTLDDYTCYATGSGGEYAELDKWS